MNDLIAIVLGGGAGKRLKPLTHLRAKAAIPFAGKHRLVDIPISNCINSGIDQISVLTQYNSASLNQHVASTYSFDRFSNGIVTVIAAEQRPASMGWHQGTADAIRQSWSRFQAPGQKHNLVLYGDQLYAMDYRKMFAYHLANDADVTVATYPVVIEDATHLTIVQAGENSRVRSIHEKPHASMSGKESPVNAMMEQAERRYLASMGVYIFKRGILLELLSEHASAVSLRREVLPIAIQSRRVFSYVHEDYWRYMESIKSFYSANLMLTNPHPGFDLFDPSWPIYSSEEQLPQSHVEDTRINCALIGMGSHIKSSRIEDSVIGNGTYLSAGTVITNSILMGSDRHGWKSHTCLDDVNHEGLFVGEGTQIDGAIIDKNVRIGSDCVISNPSGIQYEDGDGYYIRDGIVIIPKNSCIKSGTILGSKQEDSVLESDYLMRTP